MTLRNSGPKRFTLIPKGSPSRSTRRPSSRPVSRPIWWSRQCILSTLKPPITRVSPWAMDPSAASTWSSRVPTGQRHPSKKTNRCLPWRGSVTPLRRARWSWIRKGFSSKLQRCPQIRTQMQSRVWQARLRRGRRSGLDTPTPSPCNQYKCQIWILANNNNWCDRAASPPYVHLPRWVLIGPRCLQGTRITMSRKSQMISSESPCISSWKAAARVRTVDKSRCKTWEIIS